MKHVLLRRSAAAIAGLVVVIAFCADAATPITRVRMDIAQAQVPTWSKDDLNFFLYGSMSTEVIPERVLSAFIKVYPDLFPAGPAGDLTYLGLIPGDETNWPWPIGFSRKADVKHLGGLSAVGINCASCHVAQIT